MPRPPAPAMSSLAASSPARAPSRPARAGRQPAAVGARRSLLRWTWARPLWRRSSGGLPRALPDPTPLESSVKTVKAAATVHTRARSSVSLSSLPPTPLSGRWRVLAARHQAPAGGLACLAHNVILLTSSLQRTVQLRPEHPGERPAAPPLSSSAPATLRSLKLSGHPAAVQVVVLSPRIPCFKQLLSQIEKLQTHRSYRVRCFSSPRTPSQRHPGPPRSSARSGPIWLGKAFGEFVFAVACAVTILCTLAPSSCS